jgi:hypothetical protein
MSKLEAKLSANGMRNIAISRVENDFNFVVGDNRYSCPWFVAAFLSPKIAQLHALDPSICEFYLETKDHKHEFEKFLSLGCLLSFVIDDENLMVMRSIVRELGNCELYGLIVDGLEGDLNVSNVFERLRDSETFDFVSE